MRWQTALVAAAVAVTAAACGDAEPSLLPGGFGTDGATTTTGIPATLPGGPGSTTTTMPGGATTTTTPATTTSTAAATTTTTEPPADLPVFDTILAADLPDGVAPVGPARRLIGSPDGTAADALSEELEGTGLDTTGMTIWVWPVSGSADTLLVLEFNDDAAGLAEDPAAGDVLLPTLLASPVLDVAGVTRLVMVYRGEDAEGPFTFTITYPIDAVRTALADDTEVPPELIGTLLERG